MADIDKRIISAFPGGFDLTKHTICLAKVGSASHNTYVPHDDPESIDDVDYLGVAIPSVQRTIGLNPWEHWTLQQEELDVVYFSLRKLVGLLLKSNPNVVGLLWLEPQCYVYMNPLFAEFIGRREIFSSKKIYNSFSGYAHGQLEKMQRFDLKAQEEMEYIEQNLRRAGIDPAALTDRSQYADPHVASNVKAYLSMRTKYTSGYMGKKRLGLVKKFGYDTKNAAHCIRLLRMGCEFLETGRLQVWRTADADELRAIKSGRWELERVKAEAESLFARATRSVEASALPDEPNYEAAEKLMISTTLKFWLQTDGAGLIEIRPGTPCPYPET